MSRLLVLAFLAGACTAAPGADPRALSPASTLAPLHAAQIRFGLVGEIRDGNVWGLFGGRDYSYNSIAVRGQYWPRLYSVSVRDQEFLPVAAGGMPDAVKPEGIFHVATVPVRTDLRWTDGTPFSAEDVAFTVNAAIEFELPFDWDDFYDRGVLDHAEAAAPDKVRFFFKRPPSIDAWQYGALQGPVVQERFWATKVAAAAELLPSADNLATIEALAAKVATLQKSVSDIYASTLRAQGVQARDLQADLRREQGNLDEAMNSLSEAQAARQGALGNAREALMLEDDTNEPLLGAWLPEDISAGEATGALRANVPNPAFPGPIPNFDRVVYATFDTPAAAAAALDAGEIDVILDPRADTAGSAEASMVSPTRNLRFLLFNLDREPLSQVPLRQALGCVVDQGEIASATPDDAAPLTSFVPSAEEGWIAPDATLPCAGLDDTTRLRNAVGALKSQGYTWVREPTEGAAGQGLMAPSGNPLPPMDLLASDADPARLAAANYVAQRALILGLPISVRTVSADAIDYVVLSSHDYDLAIVGWKVSAFPGYLCDWFKAEGILHYEPTQLTSICGQLDSASDLEEARRLLHQVQLALVNEVPMVPLFSTRVEDSFRGVSYPFDEVLDGLSAVYGAPELAIPLGP